MLTLCSVGMTALSTATLRQPELIDLLISKGARLRTLTGDSTLFHVVATNAPSDEHAVFLLTKLMNASNAGKRLNTVCRTRGSALRIFSLRGFKLAVQFLIKQRADVNAVYPPGCCDSPLHVAVANGHLEVAKLLVSAGACTHPAVNASGSLQPLSAQKLPANSRRAGRSTVLHWCSSLETPAVTTCAKCGLDASSDEAMSRVGRLMRELDGCQELGDKCSNPNCEGKFLTITTKSKMKINPHLKKCSRCLRAAYCSPECQREHWRAGHKAECKPNDESDDA